MAFRPSEDNLAPAVEHTVALDVPGVGAVHGDLVIPGGARGVVLFAHGSGSSRHSPRNRRVAEALQQRGLATMLLDLLTEEEERADATTGHLRFDIDLLAERLHAAGALLASREGTAGLPLGYFGASTGAAAALVAAARAPDRAAAVVSRGGRPDLAGDALGQVNAPTLLIVGGQDKQVLELNERAQAQLSGECELEVVPGATHLFEEPGTLDEVARLAGDWFLAHLSAPSTS
jgi:putative phosphoribosyl transferase